MPINLPTTLVRSFVAIVDAGSMVAAAEQVFVTQSALSLQMKRLEELLQQSLFARSGRVLELTRQGELLLPYARRLLSAHDEAVSALDQDRLAGPVRIGMVQDFADVILSGLLGRFGELHPDVQIYARIAGTFDLLTLLDRGDLDVILGYAGEGEGAAVRSAAMNWFGDPALASREVVPLAVLEQPCRFREAAIAALDRAGRPYRIAVESPNLSALRAAMSAGLGISCRTPFALPDLAPLEPGHLPELPGVTCIVRTRPITDRAATRLARLAGEALSSL